MSRGGEKIKQHLLKLSNKGTMDDQPIKQLTSHVETVVLQNERIWSTIKINFKPKRGVRDIQMVEYNEWPAI